jgi:pyruvate/2-oxoglutarate dehydrogenase complex dihydrolipoamide acyltransferase (E2) component
MRGHRVTIATRAREARLPYGLVNSRICRGWTPERALTTPDPDYTAVEKRNAAARARTIRAMAERDAAAKDARVDRRAAGEAAERRAREAAERLRAVKIYGEGKPHHVTAREPLAAPPPRHQAPVEATLDDDFIARHADALAVAEAETYDAAFDPDFLFSCNPVSEFWRGLKRDRAAS